MHWLSIHWHALPMWGKGLVYVFGGFFVGEAIRHIIDAAKHAGNAEHIRRIERGEVD